MEKMEKRIIESTTITTGSIATRVLSIRVFRMHIKILARHNFGWGTYYITFENSNSNKEKIYANV